ncbi:MAG: DUF4974 domain-containing protein [Prevotella sp.]|nr:DUF4974 domain-containing protein [Prevotella sp.]
MESNDNNRLEDLLRKMYAENDIDTSEIIDEEWQKFEAKHFPQKQRSWGWMQIAAMFIGVLMLSGIAYAAVQIASHHQQSEASLVAGTTVVANSQLSTPNSQLPSDTTAQPRLYDNVPLGEILDELSTYYNIKVVYYTEDARHPRLYYQWKPEYTIEKVVEMLNNFEWLQMELENDTLYVKSTAIPAHDC